MNISHTLRATATVLSLIFLLPQVAWTQESRSLDDLVVNRKATYKLVVRGTDKPYKVEGQNLRREGDQIILLSRGEEIVRYPLSSLREVTEETGGKKYLLRGFGYGALSGLAVGGAIGGAVAASGSCARADDVGDCEGMKFLGVILPIGGMTLLGSVIGLGVGALMGRKGSRVRFTPTFSRYEGETQAGAALSMAF